MKRNQKKLLPNLSNILSKDLKWLHPYLENIQDLVPLHKIKKIEYYQTRAHHKKEHHKAIAYRSGNNKSFNIFIRTRLTREKRIPIRYWDQEDVLFFLAHEISHVVIWEHTKDHFKLMSEIFSRFSEILHRLDFEENRNK